MVTSTPLTCDVEIQPGEILQLPTTVLGRVGAGRWRITIAPLSDEEGTVSVRQHSAFLSGYSPADEGLYDDYPPR
jgi:hypothetical protein